MRKELSNGESENEMEAKTYYAFVVNREPPVITGALYDSPQALKDKGWTGGYLCEITIKAISPTTDQMPEEK